MTEEATGRVWDKEVQAFIRTCNYETLTDIRLTDSVPDGNDALLEVEALYVSRAGRRVPVRFFWEGTGNDRVPMIRLGRAQAPFARYADAFLKVAGRAGLWRERRRAASAVLAVSNIYFAAQSARGRLQAAQLRVLGQMERCAAAEPVRSGTDGGTSMHRRQARTLDDHRRALATLNDLAHLYGRHSVPLG